MATIPISMRAAVYRGPNDLSIETVPVPRIYSHELLVRVAVCGVCPTDIKKIQRGALKPPRIFGHETAGTIVRLGSRVRGFHVGERVALHHHVPCLDCHFCRHRSFSQCVQYKQTGVTAGFAPAGGGFAEYVRVMAFVLPGVVKIPSSNTFEEAAMLEPVNTVLKAVKRLSFMAGDTVMVAGQGPIGLIFTRLLSLHGAKVLATDLLDSRLTLARKFGAKWTLNPSVFSKLGRPRIRSRQSASPGCIDAAVLAVPSDDALRHAMECVRGGGRILLFAHTNRGVASALDLASVCMDEKDLLGSYSADYTLQKEVARLVFSRKLDVRRLMTHHFPLERVEKAILLAAKPGLSSLKILINSASS